ncbi:hypothetical protein ACJMK2_000265 [Sinanodonta woodiana]|uniref:Uncharacterized protein n=1 Tax=Sinanodonta woodiana TaxID=1069815 RepID=A0ABD3XQI3_SINWO
MAGIGSLKICVSMVVIIMGVIVVVSIGFVHQKVQRVEKMITSKTDVDENTEMDNINSWSTFEDGQILPDSDTPLEDIVQTLLKEQAKWTKGADKKSKQDEKSARNTIVKRAVDDSKLHDRNKTEETNPNGGHLHTDTGSAVYIRWGRSVCPNETELVYDGATAGSHFEHQGAAANTLCLPKDPHHTLFKLQNAEKLNAHNAPCALCRSQTRSSVFMLRGRNRCYQGWHTEYHGYLMGPHHSHSSPSDYICMDEAPEADPAGYRDEGGKALVPVEATCGSLPCPPYVAGRELTCAVFSKYCTCLSFWPRTYLCYLQ